MIFLLWVKYMNNEENNKSNKNNFIKDKLSKWSDQKILVVSMIFALLLCTIVILSIKIPAVGMVTLSIVGILFLIGIIRFFIANIGNSKSKASKAFYFISFIIALIIISFGVYININESSLEEYAKIISQKAKAQHLEHGYMCISSEDETKLNIELKKNIKYKVIFNGDTIEKIYVGHDIKYYLNENGYSRGINIDLIDYTCK